MNLCSACMISMVEMRSRASTLVGKRRIDRCARQFAGPCFVAIEGRSAGVGSVLRATRTAPGPPLFEAACGKSLTIFGFLSSVLY